MLSLALGSEVFEALRQYSRYFITLLLNYMYFTHVERLADPSRIRSLITRTIWGQKCAPRMSRKAPGFQKVEE